MIKNASDRCHYSKPSIYTVNLVTIMQLPGKLNFVINRQDSITDGDQLLLTGNCIDGVIFFQSSIFQNTKVLQLDTPQRKT